MNLINAIRFFTFIIVCIISVQTSFCAITITEKDTLYVLFENLDLNKIRRSSVTHPSENEYPKDWGRTYNITIKNHVHLWFWYTNNPPEWADFEFHFRVIDEMFIENNDFKDQVWFRTTPKREIFDLFFAKGRIVYLVEKDRIENGKAIMIRVYPTVQAVE